MQKEQPDILHKHYLISLQSWVVKEITPLECNLFYTLIFIEGEDLKKVTYFPKITKSDIPAIIMLAQSHFVPWTYYCFTILLFIYPWVYWLLQEPYIQM